MRRRSAYSMTTSLPLSRVGRGDAGSPKPLSWELSERERRVLRGWLRKRTAGQALVLRARIVLACAEGRSNAQVAQELGISRETVRKWRSRFAADRLEGLVDAPRSGAGPRRGRHLPVPQSSSWNGTSAAGSTSGTISPSRSYGPRPQTRSSKPSPHTAHEQRLRDTSRDRLHDDEGRHFRLTTWTWCYSQLAASLPARTRKF
jgi:transposase-like protein